MRILVATMHTIEDEYEECVASIRRQSYQNFEHVIFHNLPSAEAHEQLYGTFMQRAEEFDLLVKVDADMVLEDPELFEGVVRRMQEMPNIDLLTLANRDGLLGCRWLNFHTFRNTVKFPPRDQIHHDNHNVPAERSFQDWSPLGEGVVHCKSSSRLQALHFGIRRGIKIVAAVAERDWQRINAYAWFVDQLWLNFQQTSDRKVGIAALGGELAVQQVFDPKHISYGDAAPDELLDRLREASVEDLRAHIQSLRCARLGFLGRRSRSVALRLGLPRGLATLGVGGRTLRTLSP